MNRSDFPFLEANPSYIYLDAAASTQKPQAVIDAVANFYSHDYAPVHRGIYTKTKEATARYEGVREKVQKWINASFVDEIIFTKGTTASLNLVARSFGALLKPGETILIPAIEHHSNIVPWQLLQQEKGVKIEVIPVNERGELLLEAFEKLLQSHNVKLVSLAHISNILGTIHPLERVIQMAHARGARVCVDGAQSAGHMTIDVQTLNADFYAFSSHKMYGPTGVGILYGKRELLQKMPPVEGGGDMIENVSWQKTTFAPPPWRFEAGTPMIASVIGLGAAIDYIEKIGREKIHAWEDELISYAWERLLELPRMRLLGPKKRGPLISFLIDSLHPLDVATFLDMRQIALRSGHHCSQPAMAHLGIESALRLSLGLYNTKKEIDALVEALRAISPV